MRAPPCTSSGVVHMATVIGTLLFSRSLARLSGSCIEVLATPLVPKLKVRLSAWLTDTLSAGLLTVTGPGALSVCTRSALITWPMALRTTVEPSVFPVGVG